jgi:peptidase E
MRILATSGGFRPTDLGPYHWRSGPIIEHAFHLAGDPSRARFCYIGTAAGDSLVASNAVHGVFAGTEVRATVLDLFPMPSVQDMRAHLLGQDVIWVGGGSVANLLAVWRTHGLDEILRECWERGVVLGGVSAGSICWYVGGPTDSFGSDLKLSPPGLGFLPYGNGVHYDSEEQRRPLLHGLVEKGTLPTSHATDDGVGLIYEGTDLVDAVSDRPGAAAYVVERQADGTVTEVRVEPRLLG